MKDDPIKTKPMNHCLVLGRNAYIHLRQDRGFIHNCNFAVLGASEDQYHALVKANLNQGSCNYVVLTSSEAAYNEISAVLIDQGYNVFAYDMNAPSRIKDNPASLLSRSLATAIFFLFDPDHAASHTRVHDILNHMLHCLCTMRCQISGSSRLAHIQFFLDDFDVLPAIPAFIRALSAARASGIGIAFSCASYETLQRIYPHAAEEILDCCDFHLLYGNAIPKPRFLSSAYLRSLLRKTPSLSESCELHVRNLHSRLIIPF